jgi:hypothetical protein
MDPLTRFHNEIGMEELIRNYLFEAWMNEHPTMEHIKAVQEPFFKILFIEARVWTMIHCARLKFVIDLKIGNHCII